MFPATLHRLSAAVPATFLGIGHLAVSQRLGPASRGEACTAGTVNVTKAADRGSLIAAADNTVSCSAGNPGDRAKYLSFVGTDHPWRGLPVTRDRLDIYNASPKQP
jgi:hypothetical protein